MFDAKKVKIPVFVRKTRQYISIVEALWDKPLTVIEIETKIRKKLKRYPNRHAIASWLGKNPSQFKVIGTEKVMSISGSSRQASVWEYIGDRNVMDREIQTN